MAELPGGPRARYREQVRAEVRTHGWSQIAEAGASALSLKAIAARMGMTAPALYRYFASRDDLLTELILSAFLDLAETVEAAAAGTDEPTSQIRAIAAVIRRWAVAAPQRYLLLYGTPVPGYAAPAEATDLARRIFAPLQSAFAARLGTGSRAKRQRQGFDLTVRLWTRMQGVLSLELAGHFDTMPVDAEALFAHEVESVLGD